MATEPGTDPRVGRELGGRYRIVAPLAAGGMGVVYKGERIGLDRAVAIKFLHAWIAAQPETLKRFQTEAKAASRLSHPNCAAVTDFGVDEGAPYLVMDFVTGATLRSVVERGPCPPSRAIHIVRQILAGLSHAHGNGIVHRDIKPDNVVLAEATGVGDHVRILDFGLAKLTDATSGSTTGFAVGTPSYMAPEQQVGDPVDARTDVYAVGVVLHELLTGKKPFIAKELAEIFKLHREAPVPKIPSVSSKLNKALARAMAKKPEDRWPDAASFAAALAASPEGAAPPKGALDLGTARVPKQGSGAHWVALAVVAIGVAGAIAFVEWRKHSVSAREAPALPAPTSVAASSSSKSVAHVAVSPAVVSSSAPIVVAASSAAPPVAVDAVTSADTQAEAAAATAAPTSAPASSASSSSPSPTPKPVEPLPHDIQKLVAYRDKNPKDARAAFLLGHLYFSKLYWTEGLHQYEAAVALDASLRSDSTLIADLIKSLESDSFHAHAEALLVQTGAAALPLLEDAAKSSAVPVIKKRAAALVARMK